MNSPEPKRNNKLQGWFARAIVPMAIALNLIVVAGCSGPDDQGGIGANFAPSGSSPAANRVWLSGEASGDMVTVRVVLGGPTISEDLYSFAFDLVLGDPGLVVYEKASIGNALTRSSGQEPQVYVVQNGSRMKVGVTKLGVATGNGFTDSERTILTLVFRVVGRGTSTLHLAGSMPHPPAAVDPAGSIISSVQFDTAAAAISGN